MSLNNLKTARKLAIGYGILAVMVLIISLIGYNGLNQSNQNLVKSYENGLMPTQYLNGMNEAFLRIRGDTYKYLIFKDNVNRPATLQSIAKFNDQFAASLENYASAVSSTADEETLSKIRSAWAAYQEAFNNIIKMEDQGKEIEALVSLNTGAFHVARVALEDILNQANAANLTANQARKADNAKQFTQLSFTMMGVAIAGLLLAGASAFFISQAIVVPLSRVSSVAQGIASGALDLSSQVDVHSRDEVGAMADAFNRMTGRLRDILEQERHQTEYLKQSIDTYSGFLSKVSTGNLSERLALQPNGQGEDDPILILGRNLNAMTASLSGMIAQMREAAAALTTASSEILASTTQQAAGSSEQAASIAQTTTTVEEVKTIGEQAVTRAQEVADASNRAVVVYRDGMQMVRSTIDSMTMIKARVEGIAENILALSEQTQQVGEIIATVGEIAAQSNMLALNASVEAARAGEHGKGFAVVAGEVRTLAEQSRQATAQIKAIIQEIQKATNATVMATEEGAKVVEQGVSLVTRAQQAIEQLSAVIDESAQRATQVMAGGRQQASGVEQIALAMQHINQATVQSLASTRQAERAAQDLNALARRLDEMVKMYSV